MGDAEDLAEKVRVQLDGKRYIKLSESGGIHMIPGENLIPGMLCGTNCYAIGTGKKRFLIDACLKDCKPFLRNL